MNVFESSHPVIKTKISQFRDADLNSLEVRKLAGQIASILAVESTSKTLSVKDHGSVCIHRIYRRDIADWLIAYVCSRVQLHC
jgi:uracil phosphoribosyltransferase